MLRWFFIQIISVASTMTQAVDCGHITAYDFRKLIGSWKLKASEENVPRQLRMAADYYQVKKLSITAGTTASKTGAATET